MAGTAIGSKRALVAAAAVILVLVILSVALLRLAGDEPAAVSPKVDPDRLSRFPTLAVVGDMVCDPDNPNYNDGQGEDGECEHEAVFSLIDPNNEERVFTPERLITVGDHQYDHGEYEKWFADGAYEDTFGRLRDITWPVPGNHDYGGGDAAGYFDYFNGEGEEGGRAGERGQGYYTHEAGCDEDGDDCTWRILFLNTELDDDEWDQELEWLQDQMESYEQECLIAVGHTAPFTTADHFEGESSTSGESMLPIWDRLYRGEDEDLDPARSADLLLVGHSHAYLRYVPQGDAVAMEEVEGSDEEHPVAEPEADGVTEILVGTGGESTDLKDDYLEQDPNEAYRNLDVYGLLKLQLGDERDPSSWVAELYDVDGERGSAPVDRSSGDCH